MMRTTLQDVSLDFMLLAFFLALISPRWWIAVLAGVVCAFAIMPWYLFISPGGTPIGARVDGRAVGVAGATLVYGEVSSIEAAAIALANRLE
jgi:hypothetical protein